MSSYYNLPNDDSKTPYNCLEITIKTTLWIAWSNFTTFSLSISPKFLYTFHMCYLGEAHKLNHEWLVERSSVVSGQLRPSYETVPCYSEKLIIIIIVSSSNHLIWISQWKAKHISHLVVRSFKFVVVEKQTSRSSWGSLPQFLQSTTTF